MARDDGEYVTTHLIVRTEFLEEHPDLVKALLDGHLDASTPSTTTRRPPRRR